MLIKLLFYCDFCFDIGKETAKAEQRKYRGIGDIITKEKKLILTINYLFIANLIYNLKYPSVFLSETRFSQLLSKIDVWIFQENSAIPKCI